MNLFSKANMFANFKRDEHQNKSTYSLTSRKTT